MTRTRKLCHTARPVALTFMIALAMSAPASGSVTSEQQGA
jgi:hypothetical protein